MKEGPGEQRGMLLERARAGRKVVFLHSSKGRAGP